MTIHEQITALLNGEMTDAAQVSELLHVLAVSPEKQDMLVEQVRMSRAFAGMGGAIAPPHAADAGILRGLADIDAEFSSVATPANAYPPALDQPSVASIPGRSLWLTSIGGVLLLAAGLGIGYLLATMGTQDTVAQTTDNNTLLLSSLQDSLRNEHLRFAALTHEHEQLAASTDSLRTVAAATPYIREITRYVPVPANSGKAVVPPVTIPAAVHDTVYVPSIAPASSEPQPAHVEVPRVLIERGTPPAPIQGALTDASAQLHTDHNTDKGPWQVGLRNNVRLSLPRVYGLIDGQSVLTDREVYGTYRFSGDDISIVSGLRAGVAVGQTRVALVIHSNTGGMPIDTISELTPELAYARAFLAPEIISGSNWSGSLELGAGGTTIGAIGTFGLNIEYEPLQNISIHGGASSWLLLTLTDYQGRPYSSINFNLHYGIAFRF